MSNNEVYTASGLLVLVVENSNPNGDPDRNNDPRKQSHDQRGEITGVSFKRKVRDLVDLKSGPVWQGVASSLGIDEVSGSWKSGDREFAVAVSKNTERKECIELLKGGYEVFRDKYWDARVFGNTFLAEGLERHVRTGVVQFGVAMSVAPIRIKRMTLTGVAEVEDGKGQSMAPSGFRVVEHGVYCMPFWVNPTAALNTGCNRQDVALLLSMIKHAYTHTASFVRPFVDVRHAWYAEHTNPLGSFKRSKFLEALTPSRIGDANTPSVGGVPLAKQYHIPTSVGDELQSGFRGGKLYDLSDELPEWCTTLG